MSQDHTPEYSTEHVGSLFPCGIGRVSTRSLFLRLTRTGVLILAALQLNPNPLAAEATSADVKVSIERLEPRVFRLSWNGEGRHTVQARSDVSEGTWVDVLSTSEGSVEVEAEGEARYFRVAQEGPDIGQPKDATQVTIQANAAVQTELPFDNQQDFAWPDRKTVEQRDHQ
jgi:hypothetical protein